MKLLPVGDHLKQLPEFSGMKRDFTVVVEQGEDGYLIAEVVELPGCRTQAKSYDELLKRAREAIKLYLSAKRSGSKTKFVGLQRIAV